MTFDQYYMTFVVISDQGQYCTYNIILQGIEYNARF